jgi:pyruvate dehydrogenase E2 component (dihydrolipoamide acetyltransferase)
MAVAVIFPKLDEAMKSGKIVRWLKNEGDRVEKGEAILEIESEKTSFEIEAEASGILSKVMAKAGDEVAVGAAIAFILQPGEKAPEVAEPVIVKATEGKKGKLVETPRAAKETKDFKASPLARNIAREHDIDLSLVTGTGPGSRITREDVLKAIEERPMAKIPPARQASELAEEEVVPLSSMREVIAQRMTESFKTPHFYLTMEVDARELMAIRNQLIPVIESQTGIRLTLTDLIIKIAAKSLRDNPSLNCSYVDGGVKLFKRIDIGLVTAVEGGLVVPVIRQVDRKSLAEIVKVRAELVQKARQHTLTKEEMTGSTFTISNLGMFEIDQFSAIIQPPEAAILAVGRIAEKPVVRHGEIQIRPMMTLTLSIDHRVLDGVIGAQFLQSLKRYIENPFNLIL